MKQDLLLSLPDPIQPWIDQDVFIEHQNLFECFWLNKLGKPMAVALINADDAYAAYDYIYGNQKTPKRLKLPLGYRLTMFKEMAHLLVRLPRQIRLSRSTAFLMKAVRKISKPTVTVERYFEPASKTTLPQPFALKIVPLSNSSRFQPDDKTLPYDMVISIAAGGMMASEWDRSNKDIENFDAQILAPLSKHIQKNWGRLILGTPQPSS